MRGSDLGDPQPGRDHRGRVDLGVPEPVMHPSIGAVLGEGQLLGGDMRDGEGLTGLGDVDDRLQLANEVEQGRRVEALGARGWTGGRTGRRQRGIQALKSRTCDPLTHALILPERQFDSKGFDPLPQLFSPHLGCPRRIRRAALARVTTKVGAWWARRRGRQCGHA